MKYILNFIKPKRIFTKLVNQKGSKMKVGIKKVIYDKGNVEIEFVDGNNIKIERFPLEYHIECSCGGYIKEIYWWREPTLIEKEEAFTCKHINIVLEEQNTNDFDLIINGNDYTWLPIKTKNRIVYLLISGYEIITIKNKEKIQVRIEDEGYASTLIRDLYGKIRIMEYVEPWYFIAPIEKPTITQYRLYGYNTDIKKIYIFT